MTLMQLPRTDFGDGSFDPTDSAHFTSSLLSDASGLRKQAWNRVVFDILSWYRNRADYADDIDPPSPKAVEKALRYTTEFRDSPDSIPAPNWAVPSGDGGISFTWGEFDRHLQNLKFCEDGRVLFTITENCTPVFHGRIE
jgi:hypothetical protein